MKEIKYFLAEDRSGMIRLTIEDGKWVEQLLTSFYPNHSERHLYPDQPIGYGWHEISEEELALAISW